MEWVYASECKLTPNRPSYPPNICTVASATDSGLMLGIIVSIRVLGKEFKPGEIKELIISLAIIFLSIPR